jgi:hypothetical protein
VRSETLLDVLNNTLIGVLNDARIGNGLCRH